MFNFFSELKERFLDAKNKLSPFQIVMVGDRLLYAEGNISLMTLETENIVFKVDGGVIIVSGKNLFLKNLTNSTLAISGKITSWEKI